VITAAYWKESLRIDTENTLEYAYAQNKQNSTCFDTVLFVPSST